MRAHRRRQSISARSIILLCVETVIGGGRVAGAVRPGRDPSTISDTFNVLRNPGFSIDNPVEPWHSHLSDMILNLRTLDSISKKSDCFHSAAALFRESCTTHEPDEDERVHASISMTLCELSIAKHHSIPMECTAFSPLNNDDILDQTHQDTGLCVEALSRSAQHWSSFSGYMREIPQLCAAFQRWHDFDIAKSIYHNVTLEKLSLLQVLKEAETRRADQSLQWQRHLAELHKVAGEVNGATVALESTRSKLSTDLNGKMQIILSDLMSIVDKFGQVEQDLHQFTTSKISSSLDEIVAQHSNALSLKTLSVERQLESGLEALSVSVMERDERLSLQLSDTSIQLQNMFQNLRTASGDVEVLAQNAREAGIILEVQLKQSVISSRLQQRTTQGFLELGQAMKVLVNQTHHELKTLNETVLTLHRNSFTLRSFQWPSTWPQVTLQGLAMFAFEGLFHPNFRYILLEVLTLLTIPLVRLFLAILQASLLSGFRLVWASLRLVLGGRINMTGSKHMLEPQQEQWRIREIASSSWDVEGRQCNPSQLHLSGNIQDQASAPLPQPRVFSRRLISRAPGDLQHSRSNYLSRIPRVPAHLYKSSPDF